MKDRLRDLRESIHPGQPLDDVQWLELVRILDTIAEGLDVREQYGIKPKTGRRPTNRGFQQWLVVYYLRLRMDEPDTARKEHVGIVARASGLSDKRIGDLVRQHQTKLQPVATQVTLDAVIETVRVLTANSR